MLLISGGTFINNIDTSTNQDATLTNSGSGDLKGVIVAAKATEAYKGDTVLMITGGTFTKNTGGDIIALGNHVASDTVSLTSVVPTGIIDEDKVSIYDKQAGKPSTHYWTANPLDYEPIIEHVNSLSKVHYTETSFTTMLDAFDAFIFESYGD